ncbi:MAG: FumA C-terminus/TtdB family hydratase beta subunit [Vicinamibacterales bacterium]
MSSKPQVRCLRAPLTDADTRTLRAGDAVELDGIIYGARDAAHARIIECLESGIAPPFDLKGAIIYYVGPAPARPEQPIGSAGPTTSGRMDRFTPQLYAAGVKATIGKGYRSQPVRDAIVTYGGVYLAAIGGSGALLSQRIVNSDIVAYPELGPEAIYRLEVRGFPAIVVNDAHGGDLYEDAKEQWRDGR